MRINKLEKRNICNIIVGEVIIVETKNRESYLIIYKGSKEVGGYYLLDFEGDCVIERFDLLMQAHEYLEENYKVIRTVQKDRAILNLKEA